MRTRLRRGRGRRAATAVGAVAALIGGGLVAVGAQPAQAATPAFPSWLVGMQTANYAKDTYRGCTAVELTNSREVTGPDCFTGRTGDDWQWWFHGGVQDWGTNHPKFRPHPQYDPATRRAAFAVTPASNPDVSYTTGTGHPVVASTADAALYSPGATATFYSWAGPSEKDAQRTAHTERVAILSVQTCTAALGRTPAPGTFCTAPANGAPVPAHADQCLGDAGGALMAGGKLIGISATPATGCVAANGVRLYTNVTAYRSPIQSWGRDVFTWGWDQGSVTTELPAFGGYGAFVSWPDVDDSGHLTGINPGPGGESSYFHVQYNWITQAGDLNGDGVGDLLARTPGGALYRYPGNRGYALDTAPKTWLGNGFAGYTSLFASLDFSGDGYPDLLARDTSGSLWMYKGTGSGGLSPRVRVGTGWTSYNLLTGRGDLSGDGLADIVARDGSGTLWLFKGNGRGGYAPRVTMGTGFSGYRNIVAGGDMDHDGRQDLLGRTPGGGVFILDANNKGGLLQAKLYTVNGWKAYSRIS